ncbi:hypothetical protein IC797_13095 [Acinetobacter seifertii]|uniref:hypothetical protein n=1 Tax=Acinetobacter seifertii TaxID=1530123 RepID=UPI00168D577B|nr:hypothetical protein [Acinetobacter seifertii]QNW97261.1 hypothetical protein IC797_13095 [Acinetobacter seifertii]
MKKIFLFLFCLGATTLHAEQIDCGPYKIVQIQTENKGVLVLLEDNAGKRWKNLGDWADAYTKPFQAIAQQALAMDKDVVLRFYYTGQYSCDATDYVSKPYMIRINK